MLQSKKDPATIRRYILFQIPELALTILVLFLIKYFYNFPAWIAWVIIAGSVIKEVILYHYTWLSYVPHNLHDVSKMTGKECIALENFNKNGMVRFQGELWRAHTISPVNKGDLLIVKEVKGLNLLVDKPGTIK